MKIKGMAFNSKINCNFRMISLINGTNIVTLQENFEIFKKISKKFI